MPQTEIPIHGPDKNSEALRDRIRAEVIADRAFEHTENDTRQYVALSTGVQTLVLAANKAASGIEKELDEDAARTPDDPKKLLPKERQDYEDFLTETQSWSFVLPNLLQTLRTVQYDPAIQQGMVNMLGNVMNVLKKGESLEKQRRGIVLRSDLDALGRTIEELTNMATFEWLRRTAPRPRPQVERDPALLKEHLKSIGILAQQEKSYKESMNDTGKSQTALRDSTDDVRTKEGIARVGQGLPGSELILDRPDVSLGVWKRLIVEGGPREKKRGAAQLGQAVDRFSTEFLDQSALQTFETRMLNTMRSLILQNAVERQNLGPKMLDFLFGEFGKSVNDRLTTNPEEFEAVLESVFPKVREAFAAIGSAENRTVTAELQAVLKRVESGENVDPALISGAIDRYMNVQEQNRDVMAAVLRWQVAENAVRVGGRGEQARHEQMADQLARGENGASGIEWLRRMAPYGSFQTRGYTSPDGRLFLLPSSDNRFSEQGIGGHIVETGKMALVAPVMAAVSYLVLSIARMPKALRAPGMVAAFAEFQMAVLKGSAHQEVIAQNVRRMEVAVDDLLALERGEDRMGNPIDPRLKNKLAHQGADVLFASMLSIVTAAKATPNPLVSERSNATPTAENVLEAHLYANQLMNAIGFPGYHELPNGMAMPLPDAKGLSPEAANFLRSRKGPEKKDVLRKTHDELNLLRTYQQRAAAKPGENLPSESPARRVLDSTVPQNDEDVKGILASSEFEHGYEEFERTHNRAQILKRVGSWMTLKAEIDLAMQSLNHPTAAASVYRYITGATPTARAIVGEKKRLGWEPSLKGIMGTTQQEFLNHVRYLEKNPPTNVEIMQWYNDAGISTINERTIDLFYGSEGNRSRLVERLLSSWRELHRAAPSFVDE